VIALQVGKPEIAIEHIERAIRLQGNEAAFHNNLGEAYRVLHRIPRRSPATAGRWPEAGLCRGPQLPGCCLEGAGHLHEAVACYRRALALNPNLAEANNNLGNASRSRQSSMRRSPATAGLWN